ncbi:MAG: hypothetical protein ACR2QH_06935 [Geminicoccaceae bacterium]
MDADRDLPMSKLCGFAGLVYLVCPLFALAAYLASFLPDSMAAWRREPEDLLGIGTMSSPPG